MQLRADINNMRSIYGAPINAIPNWWRKCYYAYTEEDFPIFNSGISDEEYKTFPVTIEMLEKHNSISVLPLYVFADLTNADIAFTYDMLFMCLPWICVYVVILCLKIHVWQVAKLFSTRQIKKSSMQGWCIDERYYKFFMVFCIWRGINSQAEAVILKTALVGTLHYKSKTMATICCGIVTLYAYCSIPSKLSTSSQISISALLYRSINCLDDIDEARRYNQRLKSPDFSV